MKARDSHRLVLAMLFLPATAGAALIPSFDLESRTWDATHIVVVTEAEKIDGEVRVLESWKGELERGDLLVLKELASFASKESRRIGGWLGFEESDECVTGARMVCFLTKSGDTWQSAGGKDWRPAMEISVAWIDHGTVYARVLHRPRDPQAGAPARGPTYSARRFRHFVTRTSA